MKKAIMVALCGLLVTSAYAQYEIRQMKKVADTATDAEFEQYVKTWTDRQMDWQGKVSNVSKNWLGDTYRCTIITEDGTVTFSLAESEALKLKKDYRVGFRGTIDKIDKGLFGGITVRMNKASIISITP